jgi:PPOX class probable F420-dependent enzyme
VVRPAEPNYVAGMASNEAIEAFLAEPRNAIVIGIRRDGTPHATPNWFSWDGERFYVSTTRKRAKYPVFKRDPRATLLIDDAEGHRYVSVSGSVEVLEDLAPLLPIFRRTREKHGVPVPDDDEFLAALEADDRVLLAITPSEPMSSWPTNGLA